MIATREAAKHLGLALQGATIAVQGFGNVGSVTADLLAKAGAKIVAVTDSKSGTYNANGLDISKMLDFSREHRTLDHFPGGEPIDSQQLFALETDVLIPAALESQITPDNAGTIRATIVIEGANGPTTPNAHKMLHDRGIVVIPDILANSGGVTISYFEWVQDRYGYFWEEDQVNARLEKKMCEAFDDVLQTWLKYKVDLRTAAYIVAISHVGTVTKMRGGYA